MSGDRNQDVSARLVELEATVRGLTQELVAAEERIRQLEATVEANEVHRRATKNTPTEEEATTETSSADATDEAGGELDDIIVA